MAPRKKPKINISELLRKHRAGKSIGSTNRARLVARGLIARKSGPYKGKKKDLGKGATARAASTTLKMLTDQKRKKTTARYA